MTFTYPAWLLMGQKYGGTDTLWFFRQGHEALEFPFDPPVAAGNAGFTPKYVIESTPDGRVGIFGMCKVGGVPTIIQQTVEVIGGQLVPHTPITAPAPHVTDVVDGSGNTMMYALKDFVMAVNPNSEFAGTEHHHHYDLFDKNDLTLIRSGSLEDDAGVSLNNGIVARVGNTIYPATVGYAAGFGMKYHADGTVTTVTVAAPPGGWYVHPTDSPTTDADTLRCFMRWASNGLYLDNGGADLRVMGPPQYYSGGSRTLPYLHVLDEDGNVARMNVADQGLASNPASRDFTEREIITLAGVPTLRFGYHEFGGTPGFLINSFSGEATLPSTLSGFTDLGTQTLLGNYDAISWGDISVGSQAGQGWGGIQPMNYQPGGGSYLDVRMWDSGKTPWDDTAIDADPQARIDWNFSYVFGAVVIDPPQRPNAHHGTKVAKITAAREAGTNVAYYGPLAPVAWDGQHEHVFQSVTNNARHYAVQANDGPAPLVLPGFGFTDTATSNAFFADNSDFVFPGLVPIPLYVDAEATNKYQMGVVRVSGDTVTEVSRVAYPSQTFSASGFIRSWIVFPDNPVILMYGTDSGAHTMQAWQATIDSAGVIGAITSLGAVTNPASFYASVHPPQVISDRLALQSNTRGLFDRLNPLTIIDASTMTPSSSGYRPGDQFFTSPRSAPGHLGMIQRDSGNTTHWVVDATVAVDGTSMATNGTPWQAPAGTSSVVAGFTALGKVVAYAVTSTGTVRGFYDVCGTPIEFSVTSDATINSYSYVTPTRTPSLGSGDDAWIVGASRTLSGEMTTVRWRGDGPLVDVSFKGLGVPVQGTQRIDATFAAGFWGFAEEDTGPTDVFFWADAKTYWTGTDGGAHTFRLWARIPGHSPAYVGGDASGNPILGPDTAKEAYEIARDTGDNQAHLEFFDPFDSSFTFPGITEAWIEGPGPTGDLSPFYPIPADRVSVSFECQLASETVLYAQPVVDWGVGDSSEPDATRIVGTETVGAPYRFGGGIAWTQVDFTLTDIPSGAQVWRPRLEITASDPSAPAPDTLVSLQPISLGVADTPTHDAAMVPGTRTGGSIESDGSLLSDGSDATYAEQWFSVVGGVGNGPVIRADYAPDPRIADMATLPNFFRLRYQIMNEAGATSKHFVVYIYDRVTTTLVGTVEHVSGTYYSDAPATDTIYDWGDGEWTYFSDAETLEIAAAHGLYVQVRRETIGGDGDGEYGIRVYEMNLLGKTAASAPPRVSPGLGATLYVDCVYVPENGLSVKDQPYLDGDQSYGIWEGTPRQATSVMVGTAGPPPDAFDPTVVLPDTLII